MSSGVSPDPLGLIEGYQQTAVLAAAVCTGVADALADGEQTAAGLAASCRCDERGIVALLGALSALGFVERVTDPFSARAVYRLTAAGAPLARSHPDTAALIVEKERFFYEAWGGLSSTIRDGRARIAPWRERLDRDPAQALDFLRALDDLASRFGGELPELCGPLPAGRLLDVGGGAGSHGARLARAGPQPLSVTVLDLPPVRLLVNERHPSLGFVAGDLDVDRFGRPAGERWDVVLLANVLHDHPPPTAQRIVAEASALLEPGGVLLVYEWVLGAERDRPAAVAMFALMMMVENDGGAAYTEAEIAGWLVAAGLREVEHRRGSGPISVLRAVAKPSPHP